MTDPAAASIAFVADQRAPLRVVVADDHDLYRAGVVRALERDPGMSVIGEARDGAEAVALIEALEPDVAVLDVRMPGLGGFDVCSRLHAGAPDLATRVLVLSAFDDGEMPLQAMVAGAAGFIGKDASHDEIVATVLRVGDGGTAYEPPGPF